MLQEEVDLAIGKEDGCDLVGPYQNLRRKRRRKLCSPYKGGNKSKGKRMNLHQEQNL